MFTRFPSCILLCTMLLSSRHNRVFPAAVVALLLLLDYSSTTSLFDRRLIESEAAEIFKHAAATQQNQTLHRLSSSVFNQEFQPIRIQAVFDKNSFSKAKDKYSLEKATEEALEFWRKNLKVRRVLNSNGIKMELDSKFVDTTDCNRLCLNEIAGGCLPVPKDGVYLEVRKMYQYYPFYQGKCGTSKENGYITDLVVFVSFGVGENGGWCKRSRTGNTLAVATSKNLRPDEMRPITGIIDICEASEENGISKNELVEIIRHEFAHILGYSQNLFKRFRKPDSANSFYDLTVKELLKHKDYHGFLQHLLAQPENSGVFSVYNNHYYLKTPIVQRTARLFFNCPTLNGAPLELMDDSEDPVRDGSSFSHLAEDKLQDDLMSPTIGPRKTIPTPLTFAVLEDSGWYKVDKSNLDVERFRAKHRGQRIAIAGLDAGCEAACGDHCGLENHKAALRLSTVAAVVAVFVRVAV